MHTALTNQAHSLYRHSGHVDLANAPNQQLTRWKGGVATLVAATLSSSFVTPYLSQCGSKEIALIELQR